MKHLKRFDEGVFDVIKNIFKSPKWESGKLSDYLSDPNVDKSPVLDFLINYTLEKIKGHQVAEDDPWISKNVDDNIWNLSYEFCIDDSELGRWFKEWYTSTKNFPRLTVYDGHGYIATLTLPLKEFNFLLSTYKLGKMDDNELTNKLKELSSSGEEYGVKIRDLKDIQIDYIKKVNPESMKDIPKNENMKYLKTFESFYINESREETMYESTSGSVDNSNSQAYKSLKKKSEDSGISLTILKQVYKRGMAAWNSGHRPGTPQNAWAMGRVNSFATGAGGARKADSDLWSKAKKQKEKKKKKD